MYRFSSGKAIAIVALAATATLGGCGALDELDRMQVEQYQKTCDSLGIKRESPNYEQCMLQQQALEENASQHSMDRMEMEQAAKRIRKN